MKKLLNVMLATFLVFTVISFAVSAEDGATNEGSVAVATGNEPSNPGQENEPVSMSAYQDENGSLIIKGPKEEIAKLVAGNKSGDKFEERHYIRLKAEGLTGGVGNYKGKTEDFNLLEQVDDTTMKVSNMNLIKYAFVDGTYDVEYQDGIYIRPLAKDVKLDIGRPITKKANIKLSGNIVKPVVGESVKINKNDFKLTDENGNEIKEFDLYWTVKEYNEYTNTDYYSNYEITNFEEGKEYYLFVRYTYLGSSDIQDKAVKLTNGDYSFKNVTQFYGATGGEDYPYYIGMESAAYSEFVSDVFTPIKKVVKPNEATMNKGDVVKEFTAPTGNFMSFNVTSVEPEANAEVIAKIEARNVIPEVKTIKKDEKSVTFSVKPIDATSATKEELDTKGIWVTFSINVKGIFAEGTKVRVLHYKDGETEACETLEGVVDGSGDIVLSTKKGFSTFTVVAAPKTSNTTSSTKPAGAKDTNGDGVISCDEEMGSKNWIWSETKKACVYKVSNTSVK